MGDHQIEPAGGPWAADDLVSAWSEVRADGRPPLFVLDELGRYLDSYGLGSGPIELSPLGDGHSNVTALLRRGDVELVVRRPPRPPLPPRAHDVLREARLLRALAPTSIPVPRVVASCDDVAVIGAPFYVMDRVTGVVVTTELPPEFRDLDARAGLGDALVDVMGAIAMVDWVAAGLADFGRAEGYLGRQLRRFRRTWEALDGREVADVERVGAWLARNVPADGPAGIVHGDYRMGNVMYAPGRPVRVVAVLDWELATIGDPRADLGYLLASWVEPGDPSLGMFEQGGLTRRPGFRSRAELVARYEQRIGRSVGDTRWFEVLALWKLAVIMEVNVWRAASGASDDPLMASFGDGVLRLAERARELTG